MRTKIKKCLILVSVLVMAFVLSGCFFSEQEIAIDSEGKADISVTFWFDKMFAEDEGAIAMQSLLFAFPELQTNYEMVKGEKGGDIGYTFKAVRKIDINQNRYINFSQREDGSYSFIAEIPKSIEEESEESKKVLVFRVTLPAEIEMANSLNYEGRTVEWELSENDFTRDIILKAFTKAPTRQATQIEALRYDDPIGIAYDFVWAVENADLEVACKCWKDGKLAKEAARALEQKEWGKPTGIVTAHHVFKISPGEVSVQTGPFVSTEEYSILIPYLNDGLARYEIKNFDDRWLIVSQNFVDYE